MPSAGVHCLLLVLGLAVALAGDTAPPGQRYEFFSGTVEQFDSRKVVVLRQLEGNQGTKRTFLVTPETKVEGRLRLKARVTVGFEKSDNGDVARRIIVRGAGSFPGKSK